MDWFPANKTVKFALMLVFLSSIGISLQSQIFTMRDTLVEDCSGTLWDSGLGFSLGTYDHNENYTFTICPPGGVQNLTLTFSQFCTELNIDILRIFNGPDTNGTLIGAYSGTTLPPPIVANGCITLNFKSDASVSCSGWVADWQVVAAPPVAPSMTITPASPTCSTTTLTATFSSNLNCDSVSGSNFQVIGPLGQMVTASGVGCVQDSSNTFSLNFSPGFNYGGQYIINFSYNYPDACDSLWNLASSDTLNITNCPLNVQLISSASSVCPGSCVTLEALPSGGDSMTYSFSWNQGLPGNRGPFTVCPNTTTTYTVTLDDATSAPPVSASITITVLPTPTITPPGPVCQTAPGFFFTANPSGGNWFGNGIQDSTTGWFHPDSSGPGTFPIIYRGPNGCYDTINQIVRQIDAGPTQGSCPGGPVFNLSGHVPLGGNWTGPFVTSGGSFNPSTPGSYNLTYTAGGCSDTMTVNVANLTVQPDDTICSSGNPFQLGFSPLGGIWTGNGIIDARQGIFDPGAANSGNNTLTYSMNGCSGTVVINISSINPGPNLVRCPKQAPFNIPTGSPAGGYWTGPGVLDTLTGLFDPATYPYNWNAQVTYHANGCTADKFIYMRNTEIGVDTVPFCRQDNNIWKLDYNNTLRNIGNGNWSGPGVTDPNFPGDFVPALAGPGYHVLSYEANTCVDSFIAWVLPPKTLTDTSVCELTAPFPVTATPVDHSPGGLWAGPGITDPHGVFDPQTAGLGTHTLIYTSVLGCPDTTTITVTPVDTVTLSGLQPSYCFKDTLINLNIAPAGGILTGPGLVGNAFNPSLAGQGTHTFTYTYGLGVCQQSKTISTIVGPPLILNTSVTDDSLCLGEYTTIAAQGAGGTGSNYTLSWNQGLSPSFQHLINPQTTTDYIVTLTDGCTDPQQDTITILVNQPFAVNFDTSTVQCYGADGWALAIPSVNGNYSFYWNTQPPQFTDTVYAPVTSVCTVEVKDRNTGCSIVNSVQIPGYELIKANFSANPYDCVLFEDPEIEFIDLSRGVDFGIWDFGDGNVIPYAPGTNPVHEYGALGEYTVTLFAENSGGCTDTFQLDVCVIPRPVKIYNTFSPNGDGVNDLFEIEGLEAYPDNSIQIFNRYGQMIYESAPYNSDWNGTDMNSGKPMPDGAYFYVLDKGDGSDKEAGDVVIIR